MNNKQSFSQAVTLVGLLLLLVSCSQVVPPQTAAAPTIAPSKPTEAATLPPTPSPTPLGGASARLGPVPQNCPPGPAPQSIGGGLAPVIGAPPVWAGNFVGPHAMLVWGPTFAERYHNQYGWGHKLLWVVQNSVKGLVSIRGANLQDGSPLRPDAEQEAPTSTPTILVLDPQDPNLTNRGEQWVEFPGGLTIPKAGCYYLEAAWPGGSWRITFAVGEVPSNG